MKIGKLHNKSRIVNVLLGLAAAGVLLFASCQNIFDTAEAKPQDEGYGYAKVELDLGEARTLRPDLGQVTKFVYSFTGVDIVNVIGTPTNAFYSSTDPNPAAFRLPEGKYTLVVEAYTGVGGASLAAKGVYSGGDNGKFDITFNTVTPINVKLTPETDLNGNWVINIKLPSTAILPDGRDAFVYEIRRYLGNTGLLSDPIITETTNPLTRTPGSGFTTQPTTGGFAANVFTYGLGTYVAANPSTSTGVTRAAGTYLFTGRINTSDAKYGGFSEVIHVYNNMMTVFEKDYSKDDVLASVTNAQEAYDILRDEIVSWVKAKDSDALTASLAIEDLTASKTIRLNYVKSRTNLIGTPGVPGSPIVNFPIVLQGGWQPATGSSWNVGNMDGVTTVNLVNPSVNINAQGATTANNTYATYTVELWPVAEYTLRFGSLVDLSEKTRSVTVDDQSRTGSHGSIVVNTSMTDAKTGIKGIGTVGPTDITIVDAAITISIDQSITGAKAEYRQPNAAGLYTLAAESREYIINVYETVPEQATKAFNRLRTELVPKWVEQKDALTRSQNVWQAGAVSTPGGPGAPEYTDSTITASNTVSNLDPYYGGSDTVTLYYVYNRLDPTTAQSVLGNTFFINVPISSAHENGDDRWEVSEKWVTTNGNSAANILPSNAVAVNTANAATANKGDQKTIYYRPYGGDVIPFTIIWKPVAEFYVSYVEENNPLPPAQPGDTVYPTTSSVIIKDDLGTGAGAQNITYTVDPATGNTGDFSTTYTAYTGRKYKLGQTNIAQTDVTITIDFNSEVQDGLPASAFFDYFRNNGLPVATAPANNNNIAQTNATGQVIPAGSREYHIRVYRTIAKQIADAQAELRNETLAYKWSNISNSTPDTKIQYGATAGLAATSVVSEFRSEIVYAGVPPVLHIRNYDNPGSAGPPVVPPTGEEFALRGWSGWVSASETPDSSGSKVFKLKFTPKGAVEVKTPTPPYTLSDGVYRIKLIPARLYKINYQKFPIGNDPVTGAIEVRGNEPGTTNTPITPRPYQGSDATDNYIGVGAIQVQATTAGNLNVVKNRGLATAPANTTNNAGLLTIAALSAANYSIAANATHIEIDVYPSVANQQTNFLDNLRKVTWDTLPDWTQTATPPLNVNTSVNGNSYVPNSLNEVFVPASATDISTKFWVVASSIPTITTPNNYYFERTLATDPGYAALAITTPVTPLNTYGNQDVNITFTPNGVTTTPAQDPKTYTFKLTAVAQYNIVMMNGPTGATSYGVDLMINTYKSGTNGGPVAAGPGGNPPAQPKGNEYLISYNQGTPKSTYYGGIGTFNAATTSNGYPVIKASSLNVFATDIASITNFQVNGTADLPMASVDSRVYTIRVYPTVEDQKAQVIKKLNDLDGTTALEWVNNKYAPSTATTPNLTGFRVIGPVAKDALGNPTIAGPGNFKAGTYFSSPLTSEPDTLQFQYWSTGGASGPVSGTPTITVPSNATAVRADSIIQPIKELTSAQTAAGYTYNLVTGTPYTANGTTGVQTIGLNFTTIDSPAATTEIFTIRSIPLVKYTVTYMNQATGTVTVTPSVSTVNYPNDPILFNANVLPQSGFMGRGNSVISISTTAGSYDKIQYRRLGATSTTVERPEPALGGNNPFSAYNFASDEWEILVIQGQ